MAKTTTTPMMPPKNPWLSINWKHTVAPCDATIITPTYCKAKGIDIVLLRDGQYWFGIKDLCCTGQPLGKMLKGYYNLIIHNNPQNIYLTPKNFASKDWEKLVNALKS